MSISVPKEVSKTDHADKCVRTSGEDSRPKPAKHVCFFFLKHFTSLVLIFVFKKCVGRSERNNSK